MRRFLEFPNGLRDRVFRKLRTGVCGQKYSSGKQQKLPGLIAVRGDDILFAWNSACLRQAADKARTIRSGGTEIQPPKHSVAVLGVLIDATCDRAIPLSRKRYSRESTELELEPYVEPKGEIIDVKSFRIVAKKATVSLISPHQPRPDIGYSAARISTDAASSFGSGDIAPKLIAL